MSVESFNFTLTKLMLVDVENIDYEKTQSSLREFRSSIATGGVKFQISAFENGSIIPNLFAFVERMFRARPPHPNSTLAFSIGVQCIVNLMSDNDAIRNYVSDNFVQNIVAWLKTEDIKQQNYVCAALLNIDLVGKLTKELDSVEFVNDLVRVSASGAEFGVLLLQNLLKSRSFCRLYAAAEEDQRLFLLQLLESTMAECKSELFVEEVSFVSCNFKKSCDGIMSINPSVGPAIAQELALLLEFLCSTSYKPEYIDVLQSDVSLVTNCAYLLRGVHEVVSQKTWKESLKEAVESMKGKTPELPRTPFFGVKGNLIRLLGNLAYKNKGNQDRLREAGCIPIILDSCKLDSENPFIKEWSILTIRNLCDGNCENQTFIKNMNFQGCDLGVMQEMGLTLDDGEGHSINIAPVVRR